MNANFTDITNGLSDGTKDARMATIRADTAFTRGTTTIAGYVDRGDPAGVDKIVGDFTLDGNWHDLDLSGIVPAGTKAVYLTVTLAAVAGNYIYFRKNGNVNTANVLGISSVVLAATMGSFVVPCDSSRVIEYAGAAAALCNLVVSGYFI